MGVTVQWKARLNSSDMSNAEIIHKLHLPFNQRIEESLIASGYFISQKVMYVGMRLEILSIYSEASPLCGYVLLSGIGLPVLASKIISII